MEAMNPPPFIQRNPNAATALVGTGPGALVVWLLGNVLHLEIPGELAVVIGGAISSAWLACAQFGVLGAWSRFLRGTPKK